MPTEFVSVTVTEEIADELPLKVNGTVSENWLPYCWLVVPAYQPVINELTSTLNVLVPLIVVPGEALKVKVAVFKSRGEEFAITSTLNPEDVMSRICTLPAEMTGTEAGTVMDEFAPVCPVTVSVNAMLPSTVPGAICGRVSEPVFAGKVTL